MFEGCFGFMLLALAILHIKCYAIKSNAQQDLPKASAPALATARRGKPPVLNMKDGLTCAACQMFKRLRPDTLRKMEANIRKYRPMSLGTMCSGTDVHALAAEGFFEAVNALCGTEHRLRHAFSEIDERKHEFIIHFSNPSCLFGDCTPLMEEQEGIMFQGVSFAKCH